MCYNPTKGEFNKSLHKCRPNEEDLKRKSENKVIYVRTKFPKTIKKGTAILSDFGPASHDIMKEFYVLRKELKKPLAIGATSGPWEGTPFLLYATDDFKIEEKEEEFINDYKKHLRLVYEKPSK